MSAPPPVSLHSSAATLPHLPTAHYNRKKYGAKKRNNRSVQIDGRLKRAGAVCSYKDIQIKMHLNLQKMFSLLYMEVGGG